MGNRELNLDGGEISVLKALGLSGSEVSGETLIEKVIELDVAELIDTLKSLIDQGFVNCDKYTFHSKEELQKANFQVNSGYAKDLKDALNPQPKEPKSRRVRRE